MDEKNYKGDVQALQARIHDLERQLKEVSEGGATSSSQPSSPTRPESDYDASVNAHQSMSMSSKEKQVALAAAKATHAINKAHQQALTEYSSLLKAELNRADKLFGNLERDVAEGVEEVAEPLEELAVYVQGGIPVRQILKKVQILHEDSPLLEDAKRHKRYTELTTSHPFNGKERTQLFKSLRNENMRLYAAELATKKVPNPLQVAREQDEATYENNYIGVDWARIADHVSASTQSHAAPRTAQDCKIQWIGTERPAISKAEWTEEEDNIIKTHITSKLSGPTETREKIDWRHVCDVLFNGSRTRIQCLRRHHEIAESLAGEKVVWTPDEDQELLDAVKEFGPSNWVMVAMSLPFARNPSQCSTRYHSSLDPKIRRGTWSAEEDKRLIHAVKVHGMSWTLVKEMVPHRTGPQCRERYCRQLGLSDLPKTRTGPWTAEEDEKLKEAVGVHGTSWPHVKTLVQGRSGRQCSLRWRNLSLDELAKGDWSEEENKRLAEAYELHGKGDEPNWSEITIVVKDRTETECSDRWAALTTFRDAPAAQDYIGSEPEEDPSSSQGPSRKRKKATTKTQDNDAPYKEKLVKKPTRVSTRRIPVQLSNVDDPSQPSTSKSRSGPGVKNVMTEKGKGRALETEEDEELEEDGADSEEDHGDKETSEGSRTNRKPPPARAKAKPAPAPKAKPKPKPKPKPKGRFGGNKKNATEETVDPGAAATPDAEGGADTGASAAGGSGDLSATDAATTVATPTIPTAEVTAATEPGTIEPPSGQNAAAADNPGQQKQLEKGVEPAMDEESGPGESAKAQDTIKPKTTTGKKRKAADEPESATPLRRSAREVKRPTRP